MNRTEKKQKKIWNTLRELILDAKNRIISLKRKCFAALKGSAVVKFILQRETTAFVLSTLKCIGLCLSGFLFGSCAVSHMSYPLGFALLLASGRLSFFVYTGSALAALTYPSLGFAFFGINTLIYIIRKLLLSDNFCESKRTRAILSVTTALFISSALVMSASSGTFSPADSAELIVCCAVYIIGIPLSCFLLYPVAANESFGESRVRLSLCYFCMCLIFCAGRLPEIGIGLSCFLACVCTLIFCTVFDGYIGIPAAALFGLSCTNVLFSAPLCVAAFVFLKFFEKRQLLVYPMFYCSSLAVLLITADIGLINVAVKPMLIGTLLFMPVGIIICSKRAASNLEAPVMREAVGEAYTKRMSDLSSAFGSVSKLCFGFSNRMRFPTAEEARVLISVCASKTCNSCPSFSACRKKQYWCDHKIADNLLSGKLNASHLPGRLSELCDKAIVIVDKINDEYRKILTDRFNNNKTEILAREYATLARILKYTSKASSEDVYFDGKLTRLAGIATKKLGLINTGVTVYGSRKKVLDISGVPVSCISTSSEKLAMYYSGECGELFDNPEFILDENSTFTVRFTSKETLTVEYVKASHAKNGETVSGDTISFFHSDDSYFYSLIADGMGSGRDAAMTSKLTSVFVEKLLSGGAGKGVTIELLNNLLMSKNNECFSSVDLLEVDLIKKRASFVKAGAAPAYVMRSTKLFKVSSDTPPCGIIEGFCAENTSFEVFPGDIIIMLSDGITSSIDCGTALCDIMNNAKDESFEALAGKILDTAVSLSVHDDDMSCVIVKIR
ncbi:MAG: SpoIIE family protein phosphatase [Clostridia bacterium]|nr:SpoIIE family protein phosphatase [Clostridia bacterium]